MDHLEMTHPGCVALISAELSQVPAGQLGALLSVVHGVVGAHRPGKSPHLSPLLFRLESPSAPERPSFQTRLSGYRPLVIPAGLQGRTGGPSSAPYGTYHRGCRYLPPTLSPSELGCTSFLAMCKVNWG